MPAFIGMIGRGFANLLRFSGRDRPGQFWPYAGFVLIVGMAAMTAGMMRMMLDMMVRMEAFARAHPEQARVERGPGHYSVQIDNPPAELMPDLSVMAPIIGAVTSVIVLLLAAAVVRRLHDSGRSGLWGLLPVPFIIAGLFFAARMNDFLTADPPNMQMFALGLLNNVAYFAALAVLVVLLVKPGEAGENRYGAPPPA